MLVKLYCASSPRLLLPGNDFCERFLGVAFGSSMIEGESIETSARAERILSGLRALCLLRNVVMAHRNPNWECNP